MDSPHEPVTAEFVFGADGSEVERVTVSTVDEASSAFSAFFTGREAESFSIDDEPTGERIILEPGVGVITRVDPARDPSTEYMAVDGPNRYSTAVYLYFERGAAGLDNFGTWVADRALLDGPPEDLGAALAAKFTTEQAALTEVGRLWAKSGTVSPRDEYAVFFESRSADEDRAVRAELLVLLGTLGMEPVDAPAKKDDGEVWVPLDPRLDAEIGRWS